MRLLALLAAAAVLALIGHCATCVHASSVLRGGGQAAGWQSSSSLPRKCTMERLNDRTYLPWLTLHWHEARRLGASLDVPPLPASVPPLPASDSSSEGAGGHTYSSVRPHMHPEQLRPLSWERQRFLGQVFNGFYSGHLPHGGNATYVRLWKCANDAGGVTRLQHSSMVCWGSLPGMRCITCGCCMAHSSSEAACTRRPPGPPTPCRCTALSMREGAD